MRRRMALIAGLALAMLPVMIAGCGLDARPTPTPTPAVEFTSLIAVTGDHSTPSKMKHHSWHPVPVMLWSENCRPDGVKKFGERACSTGGLGPRIPGADLMPLAMAHAGRLEKFGA